MPNTFKKQPDCGCYVRPLSRQEKRITSKIATGREGAGKKQRLTRVFSTRRAELRGASFSPSSDCWSPSLGFLPEFRTGILWIYFFSFFPPRLPFMAPGGGGERKEINIFLIKMQFYKYFFHLMLQELNITFPLLNLRLGCLLAGW